MQLAEIAYMTAIIVAGVYMIIGMMITVFIYRGYMRISGQSVMIKYLKDEQQETKGTLKDILKHLKIEEPDKPER